jgi:hypothetical protein
MPERGRGQQPSPTVTLTATITYRDPQGNPLGAPLWITLGPEDTFVQGAIQLRQFGPGIGSVEVTANHPIVGATVTVSSVIAPATPLTSQTVTLPPFGMLLDTSIWAAAEPFYLSNPAPFNLDILTAAVSSDNPIVGDFLMVDVFEDGAPANLVPGGRMRMGSGMMP